MNSAANPSLQWETCRLWISIEDISYLVAVFEAYDNHFLVRTEKKGLNILRIWYPKTNRPLLETLIRELRQETTIEIISFEEDMVGVDEIFPEA